MEDVIEIERSFLARRLPEGLRDCRSREIFDIYFPSSAEHPVLRARRDGQGYMITKKETVENDASRQLEQTIPLTKEEFEELNKLPGKRLRKQRYNYDHEGHAAEVGVFRDGLEGLVLVDFEFESVEEKDAFVMPDFCLADVTDEEFLAGGMLCGKKYSDIEQGLKKFNYSKIEVSNLF